MLNVFMTNQAWVSAALVAMTGEPPHRRDLQVYVAGESKAAAARFVAALPPHETGRLIEPVNPRGLSTAVGDHFDALDEAGLFDEPCVVVTPRGGNGRVVLITTSGPRIIGDLTGGKFIPSGAVHLMLAPDAAMALRELLAEVPDTEDNRARRVLLPPELGGGHDRGGREPVGGFGRGPADRRMCDRPDRVRQPHRRTADAAVPGIGGRGRS